MDLFSQSAVDASLAMLRPSRVNALTGAGMPMPNVPDSSISPLQPDFGSLTALMDDYHPSRIQESHITQDREGLAIDDGPSNGPRSEIHRMRPFYQISADDSGFPPIVPPPQRYEAILIERQRRSADPSMLQRLATLGPGQVEDMPKDAEEAAQDVLDDYLVAQVSDPSNAMLLSWDANDQDPLTSGYTPRGGAITTIDAHLAATFITLFQRRGITSKTQLDYLYNLYTSDTLLRDVEEAFYMFGVNFSDVASSKDQGDSEIKRIMPGNMPGVMGIDYSAYERVFTTHTMGQTDMWNYMDGVSVMPGHELWLGLKFHNLQPENPLGSTVPFNLLSSDVDAGGGGEKTLRLWLQLPMNDGRAIKLPVPQYFIIAAPRGHLPRELQSYTYDFPVFTDDEKTIVYKKVRSTKVIWRKLGIIMFDRRPGQSMVPHRLSERVSLDLTWDNVTMPHDMSKIIKSPPITFLYHHHVPI